MEFRLFQLADKDRSLRQVGHYLSANTYIDSPLHFREYPLHRYQRGNKGAFVERLLHLRYDGRVKRCPGDKPAGGRHVIVDTHCPLATLTVAAPLLNSSWAPGRHQHQHHLICTVDERDNPPMLGGMAGSSALFLFCAEFSCSAR